MYLLIQTPNFLPNESVPWTGIEGRFHSSYISLIKYKTRQLGNLWTMVSNESWTLRAETSLREHLVQLPYTTQPSPWHPIPFSINLLGPSYVLVTKQQRIQGEKCTSLPSRRLLPSRVDKASQRRSKSKLVTEAQMLASVKSRVVSSNSRSRQQMTLDMGLEGWEWIETTEWKEEAPDEGNIISIDAVVVV